MMSSDLVILQDTEIWSRKGRVHRAKIRTPDGTQYINIPIRTNDRKEPIDRIRIDHSKNWISQLLRSLEFNYRNSLYFDFYEPEIRSDFESASEYDFLLPFVLAIRERVYRFLELNLNADIRLASRYSGYDPDPDRLAENAGATRYFQEGGSRHYQRQGIHQSRLTFYHPTYRQHYDGFEEDCCVYDLLFQYGPESFHVLDNLGENINQIDNS